ncbi:MAG: Sulfurtransferase [uncultured Thiotrichaceae bacterium]|uniref:Sulfurtransferase n=1 Tax=uncultured Thiotrichaceae bacterium TaxID=298394 RepID=A0A6S6SS75_9GAMM|nr:MAG: Sulfurtransferase [uncultured Thiotrichaceae bacterium]
MAYEVNGQTIAATETGYLENTSDWNEEVAKVIAAEEGISELTEKHWDVINFLRSEYFDNGGNQPMERAIMKAMADKWGEKLKSKDMYNLFPRAPSKQGLMVAGLPATTRKGGY